MNTKLHAAVSGVTGRLLNVVLTPGHRGDAPQATRRRPGRC